VTAQTDNRFAIKPLAVRVGVLLVASALFAFLFNTFSPSGIPWGDPPLPQPLIDMKDEGIVDMDVESARLAVAEEQGFVILDARSLEDFDRGHLPGAVSASAKRMEETLPLVRALAAKEDKVMIYCSGSHCADSVTLARALKADGYTRLYIFSGGIEAWQAAGLTLE
jgi:rhodanese-related sulfurtransferase